MQAALYHWIASNDKHTLDFTKHYQYLIIFQLSLSFSTQSSLFLFPFNIVSITIQCTLT